jgi:5'-3' exonuclease
LPLSCIKGGLPCWSSRSFTAVLQFTDMLALCGDASDNVPGVRGIGPKTAAPLLQQYGDVEGVLAAAAEVQLLSCTCWWTASTHFTGVRPPSMSMVVGTESRWR